MDFRNIERLIGHTPLLRITYRYQGREAAVYAKAEHYNYTGSTKDRMALSILCSAHERDELRPGDRIVETTSGNSGIALAALGSLTGHPVTIFMPDWMSRERILIMESFGAQVELVSAAEGGFLGSIARCREMAAANECVFLGRQFENEDNTRAHYLGTGPEIWTQLAAAGLRPDIFVAGVGTGGTVMGVGTFLKERNPSVTVHPLEPANSPTLTTGYKVGKHRIQGISDEFIPEIVKLGQLDSIVQVDDGDSINMARKLARELGLGVGISSGANFLGAVKLQHKGDPHRVTVTVFVDDNKKYLSTDYATAQPVAEGHLAPDIELLDVSCIPCTY